MINLYLTFSDAAKYADIARNLILGKGYETTFSFFLKPYFTGQWIPPVMPFSIAVFFKMFGINDFAVIATSFFYFILTIIFVFLLAKKLFKNDLISVLSTMAVGFNYDLINYATDGASESPFIFEIVAATYFVTLKKKWANMIAVLLLIIMYFTRPQAFIYIAGVILYFLLLNFKTKKAIIYFGIISVVGFLMDRSILGPLSGKFFIYSILGRGSNVLSQVAVSQSPSDELRSGVLTYNFSILESLKKIFYNLYNFYKLFPQIMSPFLFAIFGIAIFKWDKNKPVNLFKVATIFMFIVTLLVTAASIPLIRYIHPVVPLVYIIAVGTLVEIINTQISKQNFVILISVILIFLYSVGQTLGIIFLDSRFERQTHNVGKPPVYTLLAKELKENTTAKQIVVTNLDTWGSWYGERKTVWFPNEPEQLIDSKSGQIPFDAIYLTSYLIDDQNYYMGTNWRLIFNNPTDSTKWVCNGCTEIAKEFILKGVYTIPSNDDYERQDLKAILLVRK